MRRPSRRDLCASRWSLVRTPSGRAARSTPLACSTAHRAFGHDGAVALPLVGEGMLPVAFSELRVQRVDAAAAGGERGVHARLRERAHAALLAAGVSERRRALR